MCAGAAVLSRVDRVVFGAYDEKAGAVGSLWDVVRDRRLNHRPEVIGGVLAEESAALLDGFFAGRRGPLISARPEPSGNLSGGGVSERPKENASKAFVGASQPRVQIPPPPPARPRGHHWARPRGGFRAFVIHDDTCARRSTAEDRNPKEGDPMTNRSGGRRRGRPRAGVGVTTATVLPSGPTPNLSHEWVTQRGHAPTQPAAPHHPVAEQKGLTRALLDVQDMPAGYSQDPPTPTASTRLSVTDKPPFTDKVKVSRDFTKGGGMSAELLRVGIRQYANSKPASFKALTKALGPATARSTTARRWPMRRCPRRRSGTGRSG